MPDLVTSSNPLAFDTKVGDLNLTLSAATSSTASAASTALTGTDVASTSMFIGQQIGDAGAVRQNYINSVSALDPADSAGRTAAKIAARADTPPLVGGVIQAVRPATGPRVGSTGSANVTNAGVNSLGQTLRIGGAILVAGGIAYDVIDIVTSPSPMRTMYGVIGGWGGALYYGGEGAVFGTAVRPGVGTLVGGIGGAAVGGYLGRQAGTTFYDVTHNSAGTVGGGGGSTGGNGAGGP